MNFKVKTSLLSRLFQPPLDPVREFLGRFGRQRGGGGRRVVRPPGWQQRQRVDGRVEGVHKQAHQLQPARRDGRAVGEELLEVQPRGGVPRRRLRDALQRTRPGRVLPARVRALVKLPHQVGRLEAGAIINDRPPRVVQDARVPQLRVARRLRHQHILRRLRQVVHHARGRGRERPL